MKEELERKKDNKLKSDQRKLQSWNRLELNNKCKKKECSSNKPEHKKLSSNRPFVNKSKLENLKKSLNTKERNCWKSMLWNLRSKLSVKSIRENCKRSKKRLKTRRLNKHMNKRLVYWKGSNNKKFNNFKDLMSHRNTLSS